MVVGRLLIFRNAIILSWTEVFTRCLTIALTMAIARIFGPEIMGIYAFGMSFVGSVGFVVRLGGPPNYILRELSREPKKTRTLLPQLFLLTLLIYLVASSFIFPAIFFFLSQSLKQQIIWLLMIGMLFQVLTQINISVFRAHQRPKLEVVTLIGQRFLHTGVGLIMLFLGYEIVFITGVGVFAQIFACAIACIALIRLGYTLKWPQIYDSIQLLRGTWKFASVRFFQMVFNTVDILMLSWLGGDLFTGFYAITVRIVSAFSFIPQSFAGSFFPALSRKAFSQQEDFKATFTDYINVLLLVGVGIGVFLSCTSRDLIVLLFGPQYIPAIPTLQIMSFVLIISFVNWPLTNSIIAYNKESNILKGFIFCSILNVALNLLLIPHYNDRGAAIATVISRVSLLILQCIMIRDIISIKELFLIFSRPVTAGIGLAVVMQILNNTETGFVAKFFCGGIRFLLFAMATKAIRIDDIKKFKVLIGLS